MFMGSTQMVFVSLRRLFNLLTKPRFIIQGELPLPIMPESIRAQHVGLSGQPRVESIPSAGDRYGGPIPIAMEQHSAGLVEPTCALVGPAIRLSGERLIHGTRLLDVCSEVGGFTVRIVLRSGARIQRGYAGDVPPGQGHFDALFAQVSVDRSRKFLRTRSAFLRVISPGVQSSQGRCSDGPGLLAITGFVQTRSGAPVRVSAGICETVSHGGIA